MVDSMKLHLENMGPINEANINIDKITIVGGHNSTGKSTLSKFLYPLYLLKNADNFERILDKYEDMKNFIYESEIPEDDFNEIKFRLDVIEDLIRIVDEDILGTNEVISLNYRNVLNDLEVGMTILVDDGFYKLVVEEVIRDNEHVSEVVCRIINGGQIKSRRGICIPGIKLNVPYISKQDEEDIK